MEISAEKKKADDQQCWFHLHRHQIMWRKARDGQQPYNLSCLKCLQNKTTNSCSDKSEAHFEWQKHHAQLESKTDALSVNLKIFLGLWVMDMERRIQATEMKCYHRLLDISYKDHITNAEVRYKFTKAPWRSSDHNEKAETKVVSACPKVNRTYQNNSARNLEILLWHVVSLQRKRKWFNEPKPSVLARNSSLTHAPRVTRQGGQCHVVLPILCKSLFLETH